MNNFFFNKLKNNNGVVGVNGSEIQFKKQGKFKVTVTHEFFESKKYNVGYLKKKLRGIRS